MAELDFAVRRQSAAVPPNLASRLAVPAETLPAVLRGLGVRLAPGSALAADQFGPPAPAMMLPRRRPRALPVPASPPPRPDNPFAALVALRR